MNTHPVISTDHISYYFDASVPPAAHVPSGGTAVFHCLDCYTGQLDHDGKDLAQMDMSIGNPVSGPLYVDGAQPGDVLKVDVLSIDIADEGCMCVRNGHGTYEIDGRHCRRFPIRNGLIHFDRGLLIPVNPMIGVIGTAPASGKQSTEIPCEHGSNMDIRDLGAGCTVYLPVSVPGALLSMGDLHAVQGDGETACCAMEVNGSVTVRVAVLKAPCALPTPFIETPDAYLTTAADTSLDRCSILAARKMHRWLMERFALTDAQAAMLLSLRGNLRISQIVNPHKGCIMEISKKALEELSKTNAYGSRT